MVRDIIGNFYVDMTMSKLQIQMMNICLKYGKSSIN